MQEVGTYYYLFPTYSQAKKVLWDGMDKSGFPFMGHFPDEIVVKRNESEMRTELINGSAVQLIGTDNVDSVVGTMVLVEGLCLVIIPSQDVSKLILVITPALHDPASIIPCLDEGLYPPDK